MKKYITILLIFFILTMGTAIAAKDENENDGIPKDDSWVTKDSPIITTDANSHIVKAEFVLRDTDINKKKTNKESANKEKSAVATKNIFGSSGTCWATFATWNKNIPVKYVINTNNPQGLSKSFITSAIFSSAETWDAKTKKELFSNTYKIDSRAVYGKYDRKNSIVFGSYPYDGVIAVTSIWYYDTNGQILETDMLFNTRYAWGDATKNSAYMDLKNIATHELGHVVGMDDIVDGACSGVTMYGWASFGETNKRTLESADITGLLTLYPNI